MTLFIVLINMLSMSFVMTALITHANRMIFIPMEQKGLAFSILAYLLLFELCVTLFAWINLAYKIPAIEPDLIALTFCFLGMSFISFCIHSGSRFTWLGTAYLKLMDYLHFYTDNKN